MNILEKLKKEDTKGSRIQVPQSILDAILTYQTTYKAIGGGKISREDVMLILMQKGLDGLELEREKLISKFNNTL